MNCIALFLHPPQPLLSPSSTHFLIIVLLGPPPNIYGPACIFPETICRNIQSSNEQCSLDTKRYSRQVSTVEPSASTYNLETVVFNSRSILLKENLLCRECRREIGFTLELRRMEAASLSNLLAESTKSKAVDLPVDYSSALLGAV